VDQVRLDSGADLLALDTLDPKLWVALACPASGLELDARFLRLLDSDADGRIRVGDVVAAVRFLRPLLADPDVLLGGRSELPLAALDPRTPEGRQVLEAARTALASRGRPDAQAIGVEDATGALDAFHQQPLNGDGVVTPASSDEAALAAALTDIVACTGGEPDRSGKPGVGAATLEAFRTEAQAHLAWLREQEADASLRPLGDGTAQAWALVAELTPRVDDYFTRCRLAAFDARATGALNRDEKEFALLAAGTLSADAREVAGFPLAPVAPGRPLPLTQGLNPAWEEKVALLREQVVRPLLGARAELAATDWQRVRDTLAPHARWQERRRGATVERLGRARLEALLSDGTLERVAQLIARDRALEAAGAALASVERLVYLVRDLATFCDNFVSFRHFYGRRRAVFQAGTLYLDQRSCELCIPVANPAAHVALGGLSRSYLAYCECVRRGGGEKMSVVAAITAGDADNLMVGRNGLFVDRQGREWDATVSRIVDNPISVRQAFWAPYKKLVRFVEEQVAKRASEKESASHARLTGTVTGLAAAAEGPPPAPRPVAPLDVGVVAALGVAVGGITAAMGVLLQSFFGLGFWMPLGFLALLLVISGPSMLIAWLKLRQRNVGPLLDANGWAVNTLARINVPFGAALTRTATLPPGSVRDLADPFPERRRPWRAWVALALLVGLGLVWATGRLDPWLPGRVQAAHVFGWEVRPSAAERATGQTRRPRASR
jgi:hypothetical protein